MMKYSISAAVVVALLLCAASSAMAQSIEGTVTLEGSGEPISSGWVRIHDSTGSSVGTALIENDGTYSFGGLAAGTYYVRTENTGYFDKLWDDIPCPQGECTVTDGTPINVASGASVVNFTLEPGASITGTVTAEGSGDPIASGWVRIHDSTGISVGTALIGNDGTYTYGGLDSGTYYARTQNTGFFDELWDNIPCPDDDCVVTNGTPIDVTSDTSTANFSLGEGGAIAGTVAEDGSGEPVTSGWVRIHDSTGTSVGTALLGNDGTYTYGGLDAGNYYARTQNTGFFDELWDNIPCPDDDCVVTNGTPIKVASDTETANFSLEAGGSITGTVTVDGSGAYVTSGWVRIHDSTGTSVGTALLGYDGTYTYGGLDSGTYYARTQNTGYFDELWDDIPCPQGECTVTDGTPINVTSGAKTADFVLASGGSITGTVTIDGTGDLVTTGWVRIHDSTGSSVGAALIGNDGTYTYGGLTAAMYFARTQNTGEIDELWNNIPCPQGDCIVTDGTPINVTASDSIQADFQLGEDEDLIFRDAFGL